MLKSVEPDPPYDVCAPTRSPEDQGDGYQTITEDVKLTEQPKPDVIPFYAEIGPPTSTQKGDLKEVNNFIPCLCVRDPER